MSNKKGHRRFGNARRLPSGRYQARYPGPDGQMRSAPNTFACRRDAEQWLTVAESEILRGDWADPLLGRELFGQFGKRWIREHPLGDRTREEYESLWRLHIEPLLGHLELAELETSAVRAWRARLLREGRSEDRTAKAYRLVRAIMNTAVDDGRVKRNPCRIKSAGQYRTPERTTATVSQVFALADLMPRRFRVFVLAAAMTGLRWGELIALRRCDVDTAAGLVRVHRRLTQLRDGEMKTGPPKSAAGVRTVALPAVLTAELRSHIDEFAEDGTEGLIFTGARGGALRRGNFHRETQWTQTVVVAGLPAGFHFHDLRHTGNQLAAAAGATTKELMHRMGHGSMRAALIYQHATVERDRSIADHLSALVEADREDSGDSSASADDDGDNGAAGALVPVG